MGATFRHILIPRNHHHQLIPVDYYIPLGINVQQNIFSFK